MYSTTGPVGRRRERLAPAEVYGLLEPGPVVLLSTARRDRPNVMTVSWLTMLEFELPLVGCVMSTCNFSQAALLATRECVINVPTAEIAALVVRCGNCSGRNIDKFAAIGLTAVPAAAVALQPIAECFANLGCRVVGAHLVRRCELFVVEVVEAWIDPACRNPRTLRHRGRGGVAAQDVLTRPSAFIVSCTAGRAATRAIKAWMLGQPARSTLWMPAQLSTVNR